MAHYLLLFGFPQLLFKALWDTIQFYECMGARKDLTDCHITLNTHFFTREMTFWQTKRTCILSWIFNITYKTQKVSLFCVAVRVAYGHFYILNLNQKSSLRELKLFFIWIMLMQIPYCFAITIIAVFAHIDFGFRTSNSDKMNPISTKTQRLNNI